MRRLIIGTLIFACACVAETEDVSTSVEADTQGPRFTLWIHGYWPIGETKIGDYDAFWPYFGRAASAPGVNPKAVNWGGRETLARSNIHVVRALDCFCTGTSACYVAAHSTGDAQIGYALARLGGTQRPKKNPDRVKENGECEDAGGTQTGWNIRWVAVAGGAAGGSELAPLGKWGTLVGLNDPILRDLDPRVMRSRYDHDQTHGVVFHMFVGYDGTAMSGLLPGEDDGVVAYHSAGALAEIGSFCNSGCDGVLTKGSGPASDGTRKWRNHTVESITDRGHLTWSSWNGVLGDLAAYVRQNAR
jgi:hypothetical protein